MKTKVENTQRGKIFYFHPEVRKHLNLSSIMIYDKENAISLLLREGELYSYKPLYVILKDDDQIRKVKAFIDGIRKKFKGRIISE